MNSLDDPAYRLKLATGYLAKAESDAVDGQWDDCLASSQEAVENSGKAIVSHFKPVPKTHDVQEPIMALVDDDNIPEEIRAALKADLDAFSGMGLDTHIRATYGDELTRTAPWELIKEPEARTGLEKARRSTTPALAIHDQLTKPSTA